MGINYYMKEPEKEYKRKMKKMLKTFLQRKKERKWG